MRLGQISGADYSTCRNGTSYILGTEFLLPIMNGEYFCVFTDERRYSLIRLLQAQESQATFDITTFAAQEA